MTTAVIYGVALVGLVVGWTKDRARSGRAFVVGFHSFVRMAPMLIAVTGLMGIISGAISPETISRYIGPESGHLAAVIGAVAGSITLIPSIVALPLAGSLYAAGATSMAIAAFITTLNMVGLVTAPLEIEQLGRRYTLVRNGLSLIFALLIAAGIGVILP